MDKISTLLVGEKNNRSFSNLLVGKHRLRDVDKDMVPDVFDCQPYNPKKDISVGKIVKKIIEVIKPKPKVPDIGKPVLTPEEAEKAGVSPDKVIVVQPGTSFKEGVDIGIQKAPISLGGGGGGGGGYPQPIQQMPTTPVVTPSGIVTTTPTGQIVAITPAKTTPQQLLTAPQQAVIQRLQTAPVSYTAYSGEEYGKPYKRSPFLTFFAPTKEEAKEVGRKVREEIVSGEFYKIPGTLFSYEVYEDISKETPTVSPTWKGTIIEEPYVPFDYRRMTYGERYEKERLGRPGSLTGYKTPEAEMNIIAEQEAKPITEEMQRKLDKDAENLQKEINVGTFTFEEAQKKLKVMQEKYEEEGQKILEKKVAERLKELPRPPTKPYRTKDYGEYITIGAKVGGLFAAPITTGGVMFVSGASRFWTAGQEPTLGRGILAAGGGLFEMGFGARISARAVGKEIDIARKEHIEELAKRRPWAGYRIEGEKGALDLLKKKVTVGEAKLTTEAVVPYRQVGEEGKKFIVESGLGKSQYVYREFYTGKTRAINQIFNIGGRGYMIGEEVEGWYPSIGRTYIKPLGKEKQWFTVGGYGKEAEVLGGQRAFGFIGGEVKKLRYYPVTDIRTAVAKPESYGILKVISPEEAFGKFEFTVTEPSRVSPRLLTKTITKTTPGISGQIAQELAQQTMVLPTMTSELIAPAITKTALAIAKPRIKTEEKQISQIGISGTPLEKISLFPKTKVIIETKPAEKEKEKTATALISGLVEVTKEKTKVVPVTRERVEAGTEEKLKVGELFFTGEATKLRQEQKTRLKTIAGTLYPPQIITPTIPITIYPEELYFAFPELPKKAKEKQEGYYPEAYIDATKKRKAHWRRLSEKPMTKRSALSESARFVDENISARGRVVKAKTKVKPIDTGSNYFEINKEKFRTFQQRRGVKTELPNSFIERQRFRLDRPGEVRKIQKARSEVRELFGF